MRILDFLKKGTLVEITGTPFAKGYLQEDNTVKTEIRLNVSRTNILRPSGGSLRKDEEFIDYDENEFESETSDSSRALEELEQDLF